MTAMTTSQPLDSSSQQRLTGWLILVTVAVIATGMAYSLWWPAVVRHKSWYWTEPGDIWGTVRAAHWVLWGGFSYVYSSQTGLVTLPGFHVLLTPFVALSSALGLSETAPGYLPIPKPHAWLVIGPATLACSAAVLFAVDLIARDLGMSRFQRRLLSVAEAAALWEAVAVWGHAEDVLALGLALFAVRQMLRGHFRSAGWLLGAAIGAQLYVVALVPLFIGIVGWRTATQVLARAAVIPGFLFVAMVVPNPHDTLHALFDQPNYPTVDFPTPWMLLAPKLGRHAVAAGPGRIIGLGVDVLLGFVASKFRRKTLWLYWLAAAALVARSVFESVMDPYYIVPAVALVLLVAARGGWLRMALAAIGVAGLTAFTYHRPGMWNYWLGMSGIFVGLLIVAAPMGRRKGRDMMPVDAIEVAPSSSTNIEQVALSGA